MWAGANPTLSPATYAGRSLADSINHYAMGVYTTSVGPTMKYGRRVELGLAPTGAYPYFGPAAKQLRAEMAAIATANWARFIKY